METFLLTWNPRDGLPGTICLRTWPSWKQRVFRRVVGVAGALGASGQAIACS
jgi:hypothetical protein